MSRRTIPSAALLGVMLVAACASQPTGPTVRVLPGPNKPFEVFQQEDAYCRQYASSQVAGEADKANNDQLLDTGIGALLGAGLGAAVGGGRGAAVGAGVGAVGGTAVGADQGQRKQWSAQKRYDYAYEQCMYAKGNQIPGSYYYPSAPPPPPPPPPPPQ
jgi:uncharacterized protein YcfJ